MPPKSKQKRRDDANVAASVPICKHPISKQSRSSLRLHRGQLLLDRLKERCIRLRKHRSWLHSRRRS